MSATRLAGLLLTGLGMIGVPAGLLSGCGSDWAVGYAEPDYYDYDEPYFERFPEYDRPPYFFDRGHRDFHGKHPDYHGGNRDGRGRGEFREFRGGGRDGGGGGREFHGGGDRGGSGRTSGGRR